MAPYDWAGIRAAYEAGRDAFQPASDQTGVAQARNLLTIDPIAQQAYLKAGNTGAGDLFGWSVAVSGDTVVVGAWNEGSSTTGVNSTPNNSAYMAGAAYVFVRSGTTWSQQAYLKASNTGEQDVFGYSVAVSGDTVVVGAIREDSSTTGVNSTPDDAASDAGAAYVFVRNGAEWSQQAYLKASNTGTGDEFGTSVAVSGNTVVVGACYEDSSTTGVNSRPNNAADWAGAAYVFVRSGTTWSQEAYLKPSNTERLDRFGWSVAVSGDTAVVGSVGESSSTTGINSTPNEAAAASGAAYVFVRDGTTWSQEAYLKASNTGSGDTFGASVAVSGDTVIVGAPWESGRGAGAAYVFVRNDATWSQEAYLKAGNPGTDDRFGYSVAVSGDRVVVGAYLEDSSTTGVNSTPDEASESAGAAYVFTRSGTTWSQNAYLKASNTGTGDVFGQSVGVWGDTVVVGAHYEDSSTKGVNSVPNDASEKAGAAYVFTGTGANTPPAAAAVSYARGPGLDLQMAIAGLLARCSDADADPLSLESVGASVQGATITVDATDILYTLDNDSRDSFPYTINDGRGGTATGTVTVEVVPAGGIAGTVSVSGEAATLTFLGIPGFEYDIQRTTRLTSPITWTTLTAASPLSPSADGSFAFTDSPTPEGTAYYRSVQR
ncbi:MAG: cadherin-like domain-containing protein [Verrucomicrobiales bacterium]|nr:cadherin-like domain-containing protein [Verrucomicrobiales bacterium]